MHIQISQKKIKWTSRMLGKWLYEMLQKLRLKSGRVLGFIVFWCPRFNGYWIAQSSMLSFIFQLFCAKQFWLFKINKMIITYWRKCIAVNTKYRYQTIFIGMSDIAKKSGSTNNIIIFTKCFFGGFLNCTFRRFRIIFNYILQCGIS